MEGQPKRKMKTPTQLEILERVYAEDKYPSELVRSELSAQLNLTDRQVKMWFCHRRLKDRKVNNEEPPKKALVATPPPPALAHHLHQQPPPGLSLEFSPGSNIAQQQQHFAAPMPLQMQQPQQHNFLGMMHPDERAFHMRQSGKRDLKLTAGLVEQPSSAARITSAELAAIRMVEEQLGEPLRDDAPMLAYEFDPPPPGAFGTPIERQWKGQHQYASDGALYSESKLHSRHGRSPAAEFSPSPPTSLGKRKCSQYVAGCSSVPHSPRVPHEHQFIPEHPTGNQFYERRSPLEVLPSTKLGSLSSFLPTPDTFAAANGFVSEPARTPPLGLMFTPGEVRTSMFPGGEFGPLPRFPPPDVPLLPPPIRPQMSEKAIQGTERLIMLHEQEQARMEKKRKAEEARFAKELEAQEKRMRKEAERQEAMRRKQKEDQERRELEKLNREKQKELERLMRERAREEERIQRQHKKEYERMERMMQKEHLRVEKLRQKEEMRREKEATKLRAAYERATAKKLAKLSTGLMDDEQLELMQMGAFVQGLVSSSGFDSSKVELSKFPPPSVRMKVPLAVSPWLESEHSVANLFMVWRMLTTFADVIGLWPFTLDEFVQALHDYDSRLLGEIHLALLKTLVKDVEDASQAAASGSNQASTIASGGHPEMVEASYAWGFDIQEWGRHLNPLTWPEILRQYALASGFGPKWRKNVMDTPCTPIAEARNADDAVANLRSGAAAANAATQMRGKCASRVKKPQKLVLTPGTVKYAAFHVLSVEGIKGLTTIEAVDRIQKSGLRDLSTSKTPEASVSAVLSRNTKLFERVAPSTYCLRSIYRKDCEDAEEVLAAAREKMRACEGRLVDADALDEDAEDMEEREDEEDGDDQQDGEERDTGDPLSGGKVILRLKVPTSSSGQQACEQSKAACVDINSEVEELASDGMEIDESQAGEVWVQGLIEGEYTDLSVEERLCGLVALVECVNQGNTIRTALEERHDAAAALRRQLWEEVQLDKRRLKEEFIKAENTKAGEDVDDNPVQNGASHEEIAPEEDNQAVKRQDLQRAMHLDKSRAQMKTDIRLRAEKLYVIRSSPLGQDRRFNRYWQFVTCLGGADPGCGRIYFESHADGHWEVIDTEEALNALMNSLDTRGEREASLFMALKESEDSIRQGMQARAKQCTSGDPPEGSPCSAVVSGKELAEQPGSFSVDLGRCDGEKQRALERYVDMENWLWNHCQSKYSLNAFTLGKKRCTSDTVIECEVCHDLHWPTEYHCPVCHHTEVGDTEEQARHAQECEKAKSKDFGWKASKMVPSKLQLVKKLLFVLEICVPSEALKDDVWTAAQRLDWCERLRAASSPGEVLVLFMDLESAVEEDWLSTSYETIEQVGSLFGSRTRVPPWIPQTTAAVALRLALFDNALAYSVEQMLERLERQHKGPLCRNSAAVVEAELGGGKHEACPVTAATTVAAFNCQEDDRLRAHCSQYHIEQNGKPENSSKTEDSDDSSQFNWDGGHAMDPCNDNMEQQNHSQEHFLKAADSNDSSVVRSEAAQEEDSSGEEEEQQHQEEKQELQRGFEESEFYDEDEEEAAGYDEETDVEVET